MKKIFLNLLLIVSLVVNGETATSIQIVWMKSSYTFQKSLQDFLKEENYKFIQQSNISKQFIERNMLRLEIYVFLSGAPLFRETEFGVMGNKSHNPFEIELNLNVTGTNQKGQRIDEHLILSHSDYTGKKTVDEISQDIIRELGSELSRIQNLKDLKLIK